MKSTTGWVVAAAMTVVGGLGAGCATTSSQEQQQAEMHQRASDSAAQKGQYGVAADEQRKAQASQNSATMKSIDEGKTVPRVPDAPTDSANGRSQ